MYLELKESNSPFWLLGLSNGKVTMGSTTNVPCYFKSGKKQYELASRIIKESGIDEVYLVTGIVWDNMKGSWSAKEAGSYVQNKGVLISSKNEITAYENKYGPIEINEADYPKGVSRDPLPKKGAKVYTSPATSLEGKGEKDKMRLELKCYDNLKEDNTNVKLNKTLKNKFLKCMSNGKPEEFKKFTKDELKLFADFVKQLPEQEVTNLDRNLLLYAISKAHGDDLTVESLTEGATKLEKGEGSTFKNAGTTWKVIKQNAEDTLVVALDKDGNEKDRYVVAWGLQKDNSWNQGHYFTDKDTAMKYFNKREKKQESLKESKIAIKNISSDKIQSEKELKQSWINELKHDLSNDTLEDRKKQYPFKQWCDNLVSTGDFEYVKESKIVTPVGNPQTAGSFVNIDVDLDHMEVSDFIVRLAQAIRSEQTAVLEYVALMSANGITNEDRTVIEGIMKEEKNHMCALTALLYKQILMNHKENVDEANDEFTLPKLGADIFDEDNKLTESISNVLNKIITESSHDGTNDEYTIGDRESARIYKGLSNTLNVIKNIISTSDEEIVVQNVTLSDKSNLKEETFNNTQELISELKTDTNYDEIAYHIHEYSKTDKKKALELMDLLFDLENDKSPKECVNEIINHLTVTEDTKITPKDNKYNVEIDVEYDSEVANQVFDNIAREVGEYNKNNEINLSDLGLKDGKFYFTVNKEVDEQTVKNICNEIFDKATNYEYQIVIA